VASGSVAALPGRKPAEYSRNTRMAWSARRLMRREDAGR